MPNVFLSYARSDAPMVERVARDLRSQGVALWMDRQDLIPGEAWLPQIEQAITYADFMLVFISAASLRSNWVRKEYEAAFQRQAKAGGTWLIPILLERVELPPFLSAIQYLDLTESYLEGMQQLLRALQVVPVGPRPQEVVDPAKLVRQVAGEVAKILGLEARSQASPVGTAKCNRSWPGFGSVPSALRDNRSCLRLSAAVQGPLWQIAAITHAFRSVPAYKLTPSACGLGRPAVDEVDEAHGVGPEPLVALAVVEG